MPSSRCSRWSSPSSIGGILIAVTDEEVQAAAKYFFARPGDTIAAIWDAVFGAYSALFQGAIYNFGAPTFARAIKPLTETLTFATPLIAAGLGVALAFRIGMFNIGGRGQMLIACAAAGYVGFAFDLPFPLHMILALLAGLARRCALGGHRGPAEGAHRRARGHRDDHAQLRRVLPGLVDAAHSRSAAGPGVEQPQDPAR